MKRRVILFGAHREPILELCSPRQRGISCLASPTAALSSFLSLPQVGAEQSHGPSLSDLGVRGLGIPSTRRELNKDLQDHILHSGV